MRDSEQVRLVLSGIRDGVMTSSHLGDAMDGTNNSTQRVRMHIQIRTSFKVWCLFAEAIKEQRDVLHKAATIWARHDLWMAFER